MNLLDYIRGYRKGKEAHRIETDAMRDPFLAEAIDGFDAVKGDHTAAIAAMQRQVMARTHRKKMGMWLPVSGVAAAVVAVLLYLTVFEKPYNEYTDIGELYVYVPDDYIEKKMVEKEPVTPNVQINNIDMLAPVGQLDVYIPDEYVEKKKRTQIQLLSESEKEFASEGKTPVKISNLKEIFTPEEPIDVYLPDDFLTKEKQNIHPRVQIDNILN